MKPMLSRKTTIMTVLFITSGSSCRFRQGTLSRSVVEKVTMGKSGCRRWWKVARRLAVRVNVECNTGFGAGSRLVSSVPHISCLSFQAGFQDGPVELNGRFRFRRAS